MLSLYAFFPKKKKLSLMPFKRDFPANSLAIYPFGWGKTSPFICVSGWFFSFSLSDPQNTQNQNLLYHLEKCLVGNFPQDDIRGRRKPGIIRERTREKIPKEREYMNDLYFTRSLNDLCCCCCWRTQIELLFVWIHHTRQESLFPSLHHLPSNFSPKYTKRERKQRKWMKNFFPPCCTYCCLQTPQGQSFFFLPFIPTHLPSIYWPMLMDNK